MNVTLPDGTVINGVPDGTSKAQLAMKLKANGLNVPDEWMGAPSPKPSMGWKDYAAAVPEAAMSLGSGLASSVGGGLAGLADIPLHAAGIAKTSAADVVQNIQQAGTYQPRTQGGQALTGALSYLPGKLAQGADWAGQKTSDLTGSPLAGAAVNTGIQALPMLAGSGLLRPGVAAAGSTIAPEVAAAQALKLKLTPEQAQAGVIGRTTQSLSGSAKLERSISRENVPQVNAAAAQEIGAASVAPKDIAAAKAAPLAVYKAARQAGPVALPPGSFGAVKAAGTLKDPAIQALQDHYANMGTIDANDLVTDVAQLRNHASSNIRAPDPAKRDLGWAQKSAASSLEDALDQHLQTNPGAPVSIDDYRGARMQLAKIHSVEDAMDGPNVSTRALSKQQDRGVPLSGNLKGLADAYSNFPRALQDISKIRDSGPFGVPDLLVGAAGGVAHPGLLASILARPAARAALASNAYQRVGIGGQPLMGGASMPGLMGAAKAIPFQNQQQGLLQ